MNKILNNAFKIIILIIIILNGLLFASNIYVFGNFDAAVRMHEDLSPSASVLMANAKVIITFITEILYLITASGIIWKKRALSLTGVLTFLIFDGFYAIELILWHKTHSMVWVGFCIFGSLSFFIGVYSFLVSIKYRKYL